MKAHEKIKLICPFCGAKVRTYTNLFAGSLIMFKCTDKKCGATVSFDNDECNGKPFMAEAYFMRRAIK